MINWFDMPAEGLSNGGQFEIKELTATENKVYQKDGEVYNKVTVNVEGGGGSSDFSTAEVTVNNNVTGSEDIVWYGPVIEDNVLSAPVKIIEDVPTVLNVVLYKGSAQIADTGFGRTVETSGNASYDSETDILTITGNCTVTYSEGSLPPLP